MKKTKPFIHFLLVHHLAETEAAATGTLLAIALINFLFSAYVLQGTMLYAFF